MRNYILFFAFITLVGCNQTKQTEPSDPFEAFSQLNKYWEQASRSWPHEQLADSAITIAERFWSFREITDDTSLLNLSSHKCFQILYTFQHYEILKQKYHSLPENDPALVSLVSFVPVIMDGSNEESYNEWLRILNNTDNDYVRAAILFQLTQFNFNQQNYQAASFFLDSLRFYNNTIDSLGFNSDLIKMNSFLQEWKLSHEENLYNQSYINVYEWLKLAFSKHQLNIVSMYGYRSLLKNNYLKEYEPDLKAVMNYIGNYPDENKSDAKCGLLFYDYEEPKLRMWLITPNVIQAYDEVEIYSESFFSKVEDLRSSLGLNMFLENRTARKANIKHQTSTSEAHVTSEQAINDLSKLLIPGSIARELRRFTHIIIVPALNIGTLPFSILRPFADSSQVVDNFSHTIAPSLYDLIKPEIHGHYNYYKNWSWENIKQNPLIVGDPSIFPDSSYYFPSLPGAKNEALKIAGLLETDAFVAEDAIKDSIVLHARDASLLYLATHGISDSQDPLYGSFIALSGNDFQSSIWTLKEIQNTPMKAHMAVLSACQTGLGQVHDAGILGIARGFQISGVPRVIVSLWNVDDNATETMMVKFMTNLKTNYPSDALRLAMLEMREENPDPVYWASFTIFGTLW